MKGARIVKPRSAKQRAHARLAFKCAAPTSHVVTNWAPPTSWWTDASRDELRERAAHEQPRIAVSRFGRLPGQGYLSE
jgi:hypothetical protein